MASTILYGLGLSLLLFLHGVASVDYGQALELSLLYFESQRSGKLPTNQRVQWRGDSGLKDGSDAGIDLVGGYYDSGDNVKFGLPMAFTTTMLAWSAVEFKTHLEMKSKLSRALEAIKWSTDYLIKAHPTPDVLYGQVGDGDSDHECWMRPEDMTTPRTTFKIDEQHPGSDLAGETSAALAAAAIAFKDSDAQYADLLLTHARQLFEFARNSRGQYQDSIPSVGKFYPSSGYEDELLWAAAWLYRATGDEKYLNYLLSADNIGRVRTMFSWDDKFLGAQVLVSKMILDGSFDLSDELDMYKANAERFICMCIQKADEYNMKMTPGGLLWWQTWNGLQYTTSATFVLVAYADYLSILDNDIPCGDYGRFGPNDLISFATSQVDYILGSNPKNMSYMVGLGPNYPTQVHHRGASIVSIKNDSTLVTCKGGYDNWFNKKAANPNVLQGAIVGGPDQDDGYIDLRSNFQQAEPATVNTAPLVGVLARLG